LKRLLRHVIQFIYYLLPESKARLELEPSTAHTDEKVDIGAKRPQDENDLKHLLDGGAICPLLEIACWVVWSSALGALSWLESLERSAINYTALW